MMQYSVRRAFAVALFVCISALLQGTSASAEEPALSTTGTIQGRVVDPATGQGIGGISVTPLLLGGYSGGQPLDLYELTVRTDESGHYSLQGLPPGLFYVSTYDRSGVFSEVYYPDVPSLGAECYYVWAAPVRVVAGEVTPDIVIQNPKWAFTSGRCVDERSGESLGAD